MLDPNPEMEEASRERMNGPAFEMNERQREVVRATIQEVACHRGWEVHALNVRTNHVHAVVRAPGAAAEKVMNDLKAWSTRRLREARLVRHDAKLWTRHGSTPHLYETDELLGAIDYVVNQQ